VIGAKALAKRDLGLNFLLGGFSNRHQAMNNQMPMAVWRAGMDRIEAAARPDTSRL
jgi:hypothetical protein